MFLQTRSAINAHAQGLGIQLESEWLLFNVNSEILQLYDGEIKLIYNQMIMTSDLF